jgi:hypothetical protein
MEVELAITGPQSAIKGERQCRSRLQARNHGSTQRPTVGAFDRRRVPSIVLSLFMLAAIA